jgi:IclR family transcriptional regulator, pca regulon regulatory protein
VKPLLREPGGDYIQSLARGLAVIRTFGGDAPRQTLSEVAARAGLDRAGARRILLTLKTLGYVRQEGRHFLPLPTILHLGYSYLSTAPWWSLAERNMIELVDTVNESATLGVLTGWNMVSVVCVHAKNMLAVNLTVGRRSPAFCTAIGRLLLGALPEQELLQLLHRRPLPKLTRHTITSVPELMRIIERDRKRGWSLVDREYHDAICSIAVPVYSQSRHLMAALAVVGTPLCTNPQKLTKNILPALKRTAERLWE